MSDSVFFTSRREFLTSGLTFLSAASTLPIFLGHTARVLAAPLEDGPGRKEAERILVVLQLAGGNDGLNTIVPLDVDAYYKARPRLAIAKKDALPLEKGVGLHPAAKGLKSLFDDGRMAVIQGVGYPNPNRSHFSSMDIWHTADPAARTFNGWVGRYFDACCKGNDPEPIQGVALMKEQPLAMQGEKFAPLSFENPDALTWRAGGRDARANEVFRKLNNIEGDYPRSEHELAEYLQRAALKAQVGADEIRAAGGGASAGFAGRRGGNTGQLGRSLSLVARLINAGLPTRIYYVSMGGFDTHTGQQGRHQQLMTELGNAMEAFVERLAQDGQLDRVLIMTFSEFGRRVQENASGGTDHGEAAPMFLFGSTVRPGVYEKHPSLDELHRGDLQFGCDFRRVYATVLQKWLGARPQDVLGQGFAPLNVLKG